MLLLIFDYQVFFPNQLNIVSNKNLKKNIYKNDIYNFFSKILKCKKNSRNKIFYDNNSTLPVFYLLNILDRFYHQILILKDFIVKLFIFLNFNFIIFKFDHWILFLNYLWFVSDLHWGLRFLFHCNVFCHLDIVNSLNRVLPNCKNLEHLFFLKFVFFANLCPLSYFFKKF